MSSWQFQIYLDGGWIDLTNYGGRSLVPREGIDFDGQQHNEGKSVVNTLSFRLVNVPAELLAELYGTPTYQLVPISVTRDGGQYFTGYIRPVDSYSGEPEGGALERSVQIEAVDVLWKLQRTLEAKYSHTEITVDAIVRDLLELGGFAAGDMVFPATLTQVVANITEDPDDREIIEILDDLLFEYHHCLIADEHGRIDLFDWLDDGVSSPVGALQETIGSEDQEKTDEDYGYAVVSYMLYAREQSYKNYLSLHESKPSALQNLPPDEVTRTAKLDLLSKLPDGAEIIGYEDLELDIWCYISPSTVAYSTRKTRRLVVDGTRRRVKLVRSTNESWLYAYCTATVDLARGNLDLEMELHPEFWYQQPSSTFEYLPTYVTGTFTGDMDIVFVQVWGTVLYKMRAGEAKEKTIAAGERTARREEHESEYLFSLSDAQDLAAAIIQLRQYGSRRWTRRSTTYIPLGAVVTVDSATLDLSTRGRILRLRDSQDNATDDGLQEYVYTIETLETAGSVGDSGDQATPSLPAFPVSPITIGDRPTFEEIEAGIGGGGVADALPTPTVNVSASLRKVSITVLVSSSLVSGTLRFDLQISKNQVDWYSLGAGGTGANDWQGALDSWTTVETASHSHDSLPLEGTAANPTPTIYYYRARVRTSTLISDWSASAAIDVAPVTVNDLQAGSVTTEKLFAGAVTAEKITASSALLESLLANAATVTNELTIGAGGKISSASGYYAFEDSFAQIGSWKIQTDVITSRALTGGTGAPFGKGITLDHAKDRVSIFSGDDAETIVVGYAEGLPKQNPDETGTWGPDDRGIWILDGDRLVIDGATEYNNGSMLLVNDSSFRIENALDETIIRLGTYNGDKGWFINEGRIQTPNEAAPTGYRAYGTSSELFVGNDTNYLWFEDGGSLSLKLTSFKIASSITSALGELQVSSFGTIDSLTDPIIIDTTATAGRISHPSALDLIVNSQTILSVTDGLNFHDPATGTLDYSLNRVSTGISIDGSFGATLLEADHGSPASTNVRLLNLRSDDGVGGVFELGVDNNHASGYSVIRLGSDPVRQYLISYASYHASQPDEISIKNNITSGKISLYAGGTRSVVFNPPSGTIGTVTSFANIVDKAWLAISNDTDAIGFDANEIVATGGLVLSANSHIAMNTSGNVGIGTTSPAYKLDVAGGDVRLGSDLEVGNSLSMTRDRSTLSGFVLAFSMGMKRGAGTGWPLSGKGAVFVDTSNRLCYQYNGGTIRVLANP